MHQAIECARSGAASANKAAEMYGIPKSTLKDRLSGRVQPGSRPGPHPYLMPSEEAELASHLIEAAAIGVGKTRSEVMRIAQEVAEAKGVLKQTRISSGWWRRFLERNPALRLRAGDATAGVRIDAINEESMRGYFGLLKEVYDELDFEAHPERIYNMDETGVPLNPRPPKVLAKKGQKKVRYRCSGQKAQITVVGCCSATGQAIPPFIIFAAKQLNALWMRNEVAGSRYAVSENGWIDQELFHFWLTEHFLQHAINSGPILLLLDGHSSHFKPDTIHFAKEQNVVVFCLPPHTTHECQPLDCSLFGPLKVHWRHVCHEFHQKNPNGTITKLNFTGLFKQAWLKAISVENIVNGFKKSGVFPFDPTRVSALKKLDGSDDGDDSRHNGGSSDDESSEKDHNGDPSGESCPSDDDKPSGDEPLSECNVVDNGLDSAYVFTEDDLLCNENFNPFDLTEEVSFSAEEEALYQQRFEEGYDLFDSRYLTWLEQFHPEALPADRYTLISAPVTSTPQVSSLSPDMEQPHAEEAPSTTPTSGSTSKPKVASSTSLTGGSTSKVASSTSLTDGSSSEATPSTSPTGGSTSKVASSTSLTGGSTSKVASSTSLTGGSSSEATPSTSPTGGSTSKVAPSTSLTGGSISKVASSTSLTGGSSSEVTPSTSPTGGSTSKATPSTSPTGGSTSKAVPSTSPTDDSNSEVGFKYTPSGKLNSKGSSSTSTTNSSSGSTSFISSFLPSLPNTTPSRPNTKKQSGARVLTSRECLDLLKEKEMKKQKEKEEKEKRKLERERKKEEREKELQRKAEERARRAAEKARKQAEKEKKTQERIAERAKKAQEKASKAPATRKRPRSTAIPTETRPLDKEPRSKTPKVIDDSIDFDRCCACFGLYADDAGTDREWIECSCSRWIHEDCVENVIYDANSKELLCPVCLSSV